MCTKKRFIYIILILLYNSFISATTITPNGKQVTIDSWGSDLDANTIAAINWIVDNYYDVEIIQSSQANHGHFNCHFYAWNNNQGYGVWTQDYLWKNDQPSELGWIYYPTDYYTDGSYSVPSGYVSYVSTDSGDAEICVYTSGEDITHSARCLSYTNKLISKWGSWGIYKHDPYECPDGRWFWDPRYQDWRQASDYGTITAYYKINPCYRPVNDPGNRFTTIHNALSAAQNGDIVSVYPENYALTQNETVSNVVTLYLQSGSNVSLYDYSITTTSGTITVISGATLTPDVRLQTGSTIDGLYPSIASAFSAASAGQWVHIRGTHTFADHFTISSGKVLKTENGTHMNFASGKYLYVAGTLYGVSSTYTASSGTWGGIQYQSGSSGSLTGCTISNATYGVYVSSSDPTISNSTISSCTYGVYLNSSSSTVITNEITGCTRGIYGYCADYSSIVDNLITAGGSTRVAGIQVYDTDEPNIYNNTISGNHTYILDADHYSRPLATGPGSQDYQGYNRLTGGTSANIYAHDHSEAVFGTGFMGGSEGYAGYNTIYTYTGQEYIAHIQASNYSNIIAQDNYWGDYPPTDFTADGTSSIDYRDALSSDPGGGSSLSKAIAGSSFEALLTGTYLFSNREEEKALWEEAAGLWQNLCYRKALEKYKTLLDDYPDSPYAPLALLRVAFAYRSLKEEGLEEYLQKFLLSKDQGLRTEALELLIGADIRAGRYNEAEEKAKIVAAENPESESEYKALFTLFNLYHNNMKDSENAWAVLDQMKSKYRDYGLTQMAQFDMGEAVEWIVEEPIEFREEPFPETASIAPAAYRLGTNYPNPFNPVTTIDFDLPDEALVTLTVYDLLGREVRHLVSEAVSAGYRQIQWDGRDDSGRILPNGVYIYAFRANNFSATRKMILLK